MARLGWRVLRTRGSHRTLAHETRPGIVVVAFHDVIHRNSIRRTLRETGIDEDDFLRHL